MSRHKKWLGLVALVPGLAMTFLDQTILPVALPTIQKAFGATEIELEWCVNAYLLSTTILLLVGGKLSDRIGHRIIFCWGMLIFALASLLCGVSEGSFTLVAARALQGVGGSLLIPSISANLLNLFSPQERGKAMGINVSISSLFLILGPLIGGYLTEAFSWRWIFWVNIPMSFLGIVLALVFLEPTPKKPGKIDLWGFLCYAFSCGFITLFLMNGREWGWSSEKTLGSVFIFALATGFLFWREKKAAHPFLDMALFKIPVYRAVNLTVWSIQFILMIAVFRTIYFQTILGYSPIETGLFTTFSTSPVFFVAPIGGLLSDRFGPKIPIAVGFLLLIFSFFWFFFVPLPSLWQLLVPLTLFGAGVPLVFTPSYTAALVSVPPTKIGVAFGTIGAIRNLGGTMGVATIGLLFALAEQLVANPETAQVDGFAYAHLTLAFLLILVMTVALVWHHRKSAHQLPKTPSEGWD